MKQSEVLFNVKTISVSCTLFFLLHPFNLASMQPNAGIAAPIVEIPQIPPNNQFTPAPTAQGPETVALSEESVGVQGNWMKKKEWLIQSNAIFDEIQNTIIEIQGSRKAFSEKYNAIDETFDNFYKSLGINEGKLQELFENIDHYLEKKKKKELEKIASSNKEDTTGNDYVLKIEQLELDIKHQKDSLEQLKQDLKSIDELEKSIIDRLKRVDTQIAEAKEIFDSAKASIDGLWDIIDDKKARTIYYDLKGSSLEKAKSILSYLKEDLSRDFDTVIETSRSQMEKVKVSIKSLEDIGIIIKDRSKRIEQIKLGEQKQREAAKKKESEIPVKEEVIDLKKIKKQPTLWYEKIYDYIITTIAQVYDELTSFFDFGKKKTTKKISSSPRISPTNTPATTTEAQKLIQPIPAPLPPSQTPPVTLPTTMPNTLPSTNMPLN